MGTPRARKPSAPTKTARATRPLRPDAFTLPVKDDRLALPVAPDKKKPVRPISVRAGVRIGAKTI